MKPALALAASQSIAVMAVWKAMDGDIQQYKALQSEVLPKGNLHR